MAAGICWLLGATPAVHALELTADERQVVGEFSAMAAVARPLGIAFRTLVADDVQDGATPMAMGYDAGTCTLVVQIRNNSLYRTLVLAHDGHPKELKLRAILAHEMGHCFRRYFGTPATDAWQAPGERARARARHESEVQADRFALAWTAIYNPSEYDDVLAYLQTMRSTLWADKSGHYARARELDAGVQVPDVEPKSATEILVRIATDHPAADRSASGAPR